MEELYADAELYDLVAPPSADMERFYVEAAGGAGKSVLDLACGTGRFSIPLALSGATVIGGDLSEAMLKQARAHAAARAVQVDFRMLDMRDLAFDERFDSIIVAANSLMHLHSRQDFTRAFHAIRSHLAPKGQFLFDIFVPSASLLSQAPNARKPLISFYHPRLGHVKVEETIAYDAWSQISRADWYWSTTHQQDFRKTTLMLRQIYPQELPLLLELGGLRMLDCFGDFDRRPMSAGFRQVCIAVAA